MRGACKEGRKMSIPSRNRRNILAAGVGVNGLCHKPGLDVLAGHFDGEQLEEVSYGRFIHVQRECDAQARRS